MENGATKKLALLYILEILQEMSDYDHPMTQAQIAHELELRHQLVLERKAIHRNITLLQEAHFDIVSTGKGVFYNGRDDEDGLLDIELRLLIDSVLGSRFIHPTQAKDLINKLANLSNQYFNPRIKYLYAVNNWGRTDNCAVISNIEVIDEAIDAGRRLRFRYYRSEEDKKQKIDKEICLTPVQMLMKNQQYYLIGIVEKTQRQADGERRLVPVLEAFGMDRISHAHIVEERGIPLSEVAGYEHGIDYDRLHSAYPYMHHLDEKPVRCTFLCRRADLHLLEEHFGTGLRVEWVQAVPKENSPRYMTSKMAQVTVMVEPHNALELATRYLTRVWLVSPQEMFSKVMSRYMLSMGEYKAIADNRKI